MKNKMIKKIDYREMFAQTAAEDHRIGNDILLLDDFSLDPVQEYEFVSAGNTFLEVIKGVGSISVNGVRYPVKGHSLIVYFQGQIVRANIDSEDSVQRAAVFSDRFMEELYHSSIRFNDIRTSIISNPVIRIDSASAKRLDLYAAMLREIAGDVTNSNNVVCAKHETLSLFYGPLFKAFKNSNGTFSMRKQQLSSDFFALLVENFRTEHQLKYYADRLFITDRYLYVCVVSVTGKTPSYWIDFYLLQEARKLLVEDTLSINQIADRLGFSGPSQFGKFFKKHEGVSAGSFRNNYSK